MAFFVFIFTDLAITYTSFYIISYTNISAMKSDYNITKLINMPSKAASINPAKKNWNFPRVKGCDFGLCIVIFLYFGIIISIVSYIVKVKKKPNGANYLNFTRLVSEEPWATPLILYRAKIWHRFPAN